MSDGDIFIDSVATPTGIGLAYTLLHEIGHTLGLKHPFDGDPQFPAATTAQTVLAYGAPVAALGSLDPQAARFLYGADTPAANTLLSHSYNAATGVLTQNWGSVNSSIMGTGQKDSIDAGAGNDRVAGFQNNDTLKGGLGNDQLYGGPGNDLLIGGAGDDVLVGGNMVSDETGTDTADYSAAAAAIAVQLRFFTFDSGFQATGTDIGMDLLYEIDNVIGGSAGDSLAGNQFANVLAGGGGNDTIRGSLGNDVLDGGTGADTMSGGLDADTYVVDNAGDVADELSDGGDGVDQVRSAVTFSLADSVHAQGQIEHLILTGAANINGTGNGLANTIIGNGGANSLNGGAGADRMEGRAGNDVYFVDNAGDKVIEKSGEGTDTVNSSVSFSLAGQFAENLVLTGSGNRSGTGNGLANSLTGNSGNNVLNGGLGADRIDGKGGNDIIVFNSALGGGNVDTLLHYVTANDVIQLDNAIFTALTTTGVLAATRFTANASGVATTAAHRIVYETDTGNLYYDSNGNAAGGATLFATVAPGLAMTASEFVVI
ncbi:MAG TPA: hypothetical protein VN231_02380 [Allosphingosinicella sp.]|nr:hypothetical protein [Allosphingosinicella sp.]